MKDLIIAFFICGILVFMATGIYSCAKRMKEAHIEKLCNEFAEMTADVLHIPLESEDMKRFLIACEEGKSILDGQ